VANPARARRRDELARDVAAEGLHARVRDAWARRGITPALSSTPPYIYVVIRHAKQTGERGGGAGDCSGPPAGDAVGLVEGVLGGLRAVSTHRIHIGQKKF
jgi:hypothetical protein